MRARLGTASHFCEGVVLKLSGLLTQLNSLTADFVEVEGLVTCCPSLPLAGLLTQLFAVSGVDEPRGDGHISRLPCRG